MMKQAVTNENTGALDASVSYIWTRTSALDMMRRPLMDLLFEAQKILRTHFDPHAIEPARLSNIKTGGCPEDCGYCSQSAHHQSGLKASKLMSADAVEAEALQAKSEGATRFCMGAAWREPKDRDMPALIDMIQRVKGLGLETCMTLGMLSESQTSQLAEAGLDFYNHNLDTGEQYYDKVVTTRSYQDRLDTLTLVEQAGINVCCGGILGLGEAEEDRADMLVTLANLPAQPASVPLNALVAIKGTPMQNQKRIDEIDFIRCVATARIMLPRSVIRLSAGRRSMSEVTQALCFFAGANSIFLGSKLLTAPNTEKGADEAMLEKLGMFLSPVSSDDQPTAKTS